MITTTEKCHILGNLSLRDTGKYCRILLPQEVSQTVKFIDSYIGYQWLGMWEDKRVINSMGTKVSVNYYRSVYFTCSQQDFVKRIDCMLSYYYNKMQKKRKLLHKQKIIVRKEKIIK